jgi:hypothetical protein
MATDFKYASQSDLNRYVGDIVADADSKRQIYDWTQLFTHGGYSLYEAHNSGFVDVLFEEGEDLTPYKVSENYTDSTANTAEAVDITETAIDVTDGSLFGYGDIIRIDSEKMLVTNISSNTITVKRGFLGTTPTTHDTATDIYIGLEWSKPNEWVYDSTSDAVLLYVVNSIDPNDIIIEAGFDNSTYYDQMLVDASMELNNLLDARYPTPLPKYDHFDADTAHSLASTEYDAIIIKITCYLAASNALRAIGETEKADYYYDLVTNAEKTGMADRLNLGEFKLAFEVDSHDDKGKVRNISKTGTMDIVETAGEWHGEKYDVVRITCTTGGGYGTAIVKAETYGNDALFGTTTENIKVTGGLQEIVNGLYVRFQGASMNLDTTPDQWEITVSGSDRKLTNAQTGAIDLTRRGYSV